MFGVCEYCIRLTAFSLRPGRLIGRHGVLRWQKGGQEDANPGSGHKAWHGCWRLPNQRLSCSGLAPAKGVSRRV